LIAITLACLFGSGFLAKLPSVADYPVPKVEIYVPSRAGGTTDQAARAFAAALERNSGVDAIVINQSAGGGTVAVNSVYRAKPNGSKLLVFHAMLHVAHDAGRLGIAASDLDPIATLSRSSDVYVIKANAPYSDIETLFEYARSTPLTVASQTGGTTELKAEAFAKAADAAGASVRPVAVGGMAKRLSAILGGQVDISILDLKTTRQYLDAGTLLPVGLISSERDPFEPEWPTATEVGVAAALSQVNEIYAPPGMDAETRRVVHEAVARALADPALAESLRRIKQNPDYRIGEEAAAFIASEAALVAEMAR